MECLFLLSYNWEKLQASFVNIINQCIRPLHEMLAVSS